MSIWVRLQKDQYNGMEPKILSDNVVEVLRLRNGEETYETKDTSGRILRVALIVYPTQNFIV